MTRLFAAVAVAGLALFAGGFVTTSALGSHEGSDFWLHCKGIPVVCVEEKPPGTVTEPPPASISADDFESSALGSNWISHTSSTAGIVNNSDLGLLSGAFSLLSWAAAVPSDQFSEAEVSVGSDSRMAKGVFVRRRALDGARYQFHYDTNGTDSEPRPHWQIKYDGLSATQNRVLAISLASAAPAERDVLRIEVRGTTIRGLKNGQLVLSVVDSRITSGTAGVAFTTAGLTIPLPSPVFERWAGGGL